MVRKTYCAYENIAPALDFLLERADTVRFNRVTWGEGMIFRARRGHDDDPRFLEQLRRMKNDFVKKVSSKEHYGEEMRDDLTEQYFYRLTPTLKQFLINADSGEDEYVLYGFQDPAFYRQGAMIGFVISAEGYIFLFDLSSSEIETLKNQGVTIDDDEYHFGRKKKAIP